MERLSNVIRERKFYLEVIKIIEEEIKPFLMLKEIGLTPREYCGGDGLSKLNSEIGNKFEMSIFLNFKRRGFVIEKCPIGIKGYDFRIFNKEKNKWDYFEIKTSTNKDLFTSQKHHYYKEDLNYIGINYDYNFDKIPNDKKIINNLFVVIFDQETIRNCDAWREKSSSGWTSLRFISDKKKN